MKKRQYDLTLIIKGDKTIEEAQNVFEDIKAKLEKNDFEIIKTTGPILKDMAYEINKYNQGYYGTFIFSTESFITKDLLEIFKFNENVLRYLTTEYSDAIGLRKMKHDRRVKRYQADIAKKDITKEKEVDMVQEKIDKSEDIENQISKEKNEEDIILKEHEVSTAQKQIDLESLDEKLDELLK